MSDLYEHMVCDIGVAESKSLPELRYLLSLNVCMCWVSGSDTCGMEQFCACATGCFCIRIRQLVAKGCYCR